MTQKGKITRILVKFKEYLKSNKIFLEILAPVLLAAMALFVSIMQCNISNEQTDLIAEQINLVSEQNKLAKKQTELIALQDSLAEIDILRAKKADSLQTIYSERQAKSDSIQLIIAEKQTKIMDLQTSFLYTPRLNAYFNLKSFRNPKLGLHNEGGKDIYNIEIIRKIGEYYEYDKIFNITKEGIMDDLFKKIDILGPNAKVEIPLDTTYVQSCFRMFQLGFELQANKYNERYTRQIIPIIRFVIKYESGADHKKSKLLKYLVLDTWPPLRPSSFTLEDLDYYFFGEYIEKIKENNNIE